MAYESNYITMIGNLTEDPELRFTPNGTPVATIRIASNRRWTGRDGQQQEETTFMNVNCWRDLGENVAESLTKGDRAIVIGRVKVRSYENQQGQTVWVTEIEADEVSPSLRWARADVHKTSGKGAGRAAKQGGYATVSSKTQAPVDDDAAFGGGENFDIDDESAAPMF